MKFFISIGCGLEQKYAIGIAKKLGFGIIGFDGNKDCECKSLVNEFYHIDIKNIKEIKNIIDVKNNNEKINIIGILPTPIGRYVSTLGILNEYYNFIGPNAFIAETCSNKRLVNKYLKEINLNVPIQYSINNLKNIIYPVIAKPIFGSGSRFVKVLNNEFELLSFYNQYNEEDRFGELLIEEFIEGKEYSIEVLVQNNEITFFHIIDKEITPLPFRQEISYTSPINITNIEYKNIYETIKLFINNLNVENSIFHIDAIYSNKKTFVIDIAPRPGGVNIMSRIINYTYEFDFIEYWIRYMVEGIKLPELSIKNYVHSQYLNFENCIVNKIPEIDPLVKDNNIIYEEIKLKNNMELGNIIDCNGISERGCYIIRDSDLNKLKERNIKIYNEFKKYIIVK